MKMAGHYAGWVTLTVWRKKSTLLALTLIAVLILACVHFKPRRFNEGNAVGGDDNSRQAGKVGAMQDKRTLLGGSSVHFVASPSLPSVPSQDRIVVNLDDAPFREDLLKRNALPAESAVLNEDFTAQKSLFIPKQRLLHFDLKGAPPKVSYLKKIMALSKEMGATGILLEWEDMFPWSGALSVMAASNAYSRADVKEIVDWANQLGLDVIPLIQTFGHVELALKHEEFMHLREVPESSQALCPSLNASMDFVQMMIEEVMELHPTSKYLHIGCDEVFQLGECIRCRTQPRENLFLNHVARVAQFVKSKYQNVTPIVWDDMLRHLAPTSLEQYRLGELVEPMVWVYAEDIYRFVPFPVWDKFAAIFPRIWGASAFKGAFGETAYIPNVKRHLENNLRWLDVMGNEASKFKYGFQGIAITGWQRYDHFSVLCELLPASIPSLALALVATSHGYMNASLRTALNNHLNCGIFGPTTYFNLNSDPYLWETYSRCGFPGHAFFKLTYRLNVAEKDADELITSIRKQKGWMTKYNVRHNFSTPLRVDELMAEHPRIYHTVSSLARSASDALADVFDANTIAEWIEQKVYPIVVQLEDIQRDANMLKARKIWPKRPFAPLKDLARLGVRLPGDESNEIAPPG